MGLRAALKLLYGTAWHVRGDAIIDAMTPAADGAAEANLPLVPDASLNISNLNAVVVTQIGAVTQTVTNLLAGLNATQGKVGLFGVTPVSQLGTVTTVPTTAATSTTPWGFGSAAQANALVAEVGELKTRLQALGLIP